MDKVDSVLNRDITAAYLSILPGLGHLYKHQWGIGFTILTLGNIIAGLVTGLLGFATLGAAIIVAPVVWIAWVAYDAYHEPDLSHRTGKTAPIPASE